MTKNNGTESFRDTIGTVGADGKRKWVYPKQPKGRFYQWRTYLSYLLLAVLFGLPWIRVGGEPFVMLNVLERHFILFGLSFSPQDFHLFAILMITGVVFVILFTVVFGRIFCGWICPQTIFMEMVFRKIEYWIEGDANAQRRLAKAPWNGKKIRKKALKHGLFLLVSAVIAHTFLAYIISTDNVIELVTQSPLADPFGFLAIIVFIGVFYFVFSYMREQVCIAVCPYGRLQGVMLDEKSINVIYDYERGEPRGKIKKGQPRKSSCTDCENCRDGVDTCSDQIKNRLEHAMTQAEKHGVLPPSTAPRQSRNPGPAAAPYSVSTQQPRSQEVKESGPLNFSETAGATLVAEAPVLKGDCIDCKLCVQVCPTGIDIRDGVQMECINCTACIDACDEVMDKIDLPRGLIRYDSESGVARQERKIWTPRVMAYSAVLLALIVLNVVLLGSRDGLDVILLRTPGTLYQTNTDGSINNLYTYQIVNKTGADLSLRFELANIPAGSVRFVGTAPIAKPDAITEGALFIDLPLDPGPDFDGDVEVVVWSGEEQLETFTTTFVHPKK